MHQELEMIDSQGKEETGNKKFWNIVFTEIGLLILVGGILLTLILAT